MIAQINIYKEIEVEADDYISAKKNYGIRQ